MPDLAMLLPARRPDLLIRAVGNPGPYVVKDPHTGEFFHIGVAEHFLLTQLDGQQTAEAVCAAYAERFGEPLSEADLGEFVELARSQGLLQPASGVASAPRELSALTQPGSPELPALTQPGSPARQSILHWRKSLWDPDRFFTWLAPRIGFCWTPAFLLCSAGCIVLAVFLVWANRQELAGNFAQALRWETAVLVWLTLLVIGILHECAHGLTCKHHGGEVHEIGFLLLFFLPCFYCNVSDAWLFREKAKRLWVTFAGGYFELFLWALAVFVWRLTLPGTRVNYLAFVVLSVGGLQTLFNFNPLLKLDGYYLLSDWLEVPNLRQRALDHLTGHLRWLLWGAARPDPQPRSKLLLGFGLVSWLYSLGFLVLMLWGLCHFLGSNGGWLGLGAVALLGLVSARGLFQGFTAGEVKTMIVRRHQRTAGWVLALGALAAVLCLVPIEDRVSGPFQVRPTIRAELRAPVAGFLQVIHHDEGDRVSSGTVVVQLEVPDLASRIAQKRAAVREAQAKLRLLEAGPRYEAIVEQRRRVERAQAWRDLAEKDLGRGRQALQEELKRLDEQIAQHQAEQAYAEGSRARAGRLVGQRALSEQEYQEAEKQQRVSRALAEQAQAQKRARQALGAQEAEAELARRDKELADARGTLALLEAGTRPEEIEAERARLARLQEEARYLERLQEQLPVASPVAGLIVSARLKEKVGQYVREGELICVVEEPSALEAEILLAEQDMARVQPGQAVALKARALPFETFPIRVDRLAPSAARGDGLSTVTVYGRLEGSPTELRPGMTGHARIWTGQRCVGAVLLDRALRYLRTEFWW
jgi:multidrug efflux pump subunit AcrA (membrane-fusion protein)